MTSKKKLSTPDLSRIPYHVSRLLKLSLSTAVAISLYGVAERLGIDKTVWVQDVQNRVFSTLGQPNWLAAYLIALAPLAWYFALKTQISKLKIQKNIKAQNPKQFGNWNFGFHLSLGFWIWSFIAALFFFVLLFTRSRSGLLGFAVADVVFWGLVFARPRLAKQGEALRNFLVVHVAFFLIVFFNGSYIYSVDKWFTLTAWKQHLQPAITSQQATPSAAVTSNTPIYTAPLLEFGGTESSVIRKYVWQGAINAWKSSAKTFLVGTGTETFAFAFYQFRPAGHNMTSEWDFLYNKAHNEYLNYLATTGVFGLGSYLLIIGAFIYWFTKQFLISKYLGSKQSANSKSQLDQLCQLEIRNYLMPALFAGWTSVLVTNFFGFSVVIVQLFLFLFPAMMVVLADSSDMSAKKSHVISLNISPQGSRWTSGAILVALLVYLVLLARTWWADVQFAQGYQFSRAASYVRAQPFMQKAIAINPTEPLYHDEYSTVLAALAATAAEQKQATLAGQLAKQALTEGDTAIKISPKNVNFWKSRTKVFYAFSNFDQDFNQAAVTTLARASELSPNDPKILYNLAILSGRQNDNPRAIEILKHTIDLKPNYRDAYFALHLFYKEVNDQQRASEVIQTYLQKVDPNDRDFQSRL